MHKETRKERLDKTYAQSPNVKGKQPYCLITTKLRKCRQLHCLTSDKLYTNIHLNWHIIKKTFEHRSKNKRETCEQETQYLCFRGNPDDGFLPLFSIKQTENALTTQRVALRTLGKRVQYNIVEQYQVTHMESLNFKWILLQFFPSIGVHFTLQDKNQPVYIFFVREASIDATHSLFPYFLSSTKDDNNLQRNSTFSCITNAGNKKKRHGGLLRNREKHQLITCHFNHITSGFEEHFLLDLASF